MKRYFLFYGDIYYPDGGWSDFKGSYDTPKEAYAAYESVKDSFAWYHVVDGSTGEKLEPQESSVRVRDIVNNQKTS